MADVNNETFSFEDNSDEVLREFLKAKLQALQIAGLLIEGSINPLVPVDSTGLVMSLTHKVKENEGAVYIGVNQAYAIYVEFGTGIYAENGGGRKTPWYYKNDEGKWIKTVGQKPQSYMREGYNRIKSSVEDQVGAVFKTYMK